MPALRTVAERVTASVSTGAAGEDDMPVTVRSGFGAGSPMTWNSATWPLGAPVLAVKLRRTSAVGRAHRDGHRVAGGRVEGVRRRADQRGEAGRTLLATLDREGLPAGAPRGAGVELDHDRPGGGVGAQLDGQVRRISTALPVGGGVVVVGVGGHEGEDGRGCLDRLAHREVGAVGHRAGPGHGVARRRLVAGRVARLDVVRHGRARGLAVGVGEPRDGRPQGAVRVDVVARHADVVGRRVPGEPDLSARRLGVCQAGGRGRGLGVAGRGAVHLELGELPGGPAGVAGEGQPQVTGGGGAEVDGHGVAGGRVERVARARLEVGERGAGGAALHGQRLRPGLPGGGRRQLEDELVARSPRRPGRPAATAGRRCCGSPSTCPGCRHRRCRRRTRRRSCWR